MTEVDSDVIKTVELVHDIVYTIGRGEQVSGVLYIIPVSCPGESCLKTHLEGPLEIKSYGDVTERSRKGRKLGLGTKNGKKNIHDTSSEIVIETSSGNMENVNSLETNFCRSERAEMKQSDG